MARVEPSRTLSARILLARPAMADPTFSRSVVYIIEHDGDGAVGVIINRPTGVAVTEALPTLSPLVSDEEVFSEGGPVATSSVLALGADLGSPPTLIDLDEAASSGVRPASLRLFVGYAGWGAGQLDRELLEDAWLVARDLCQPEGHAADVFSVNPSTLWRELLRREPPPISQLALYPDDLAAN